MSDSKANCVPVLSENELLEKPDEIPDTEVKQSEKSTPPVLSGPLTPFEDDPLKSKPALDVPKEESDESNFKLEGIKAGIEAAIEEQSEISFTPESVYNDLTNMLNAGWTESNIATLVADHFGDAVRVYKRENDRIDNIYATIFAFHFLDSSTNKHHVLYHSRNASFMRTKILHYFVPFNGPYLSEGLPRVIFKDFFRGQQQDQKDSNGDFVSYVGSKYQSYYADKEFPLFAYVSYPRNDLVSKFHYKLLSV
jgi:hypothetical protein